MKIIAILILLTVTFSAAVAGERFVSTIGTVQREISADRTKMVLEVKATDKTIEGSSAKLEQMLAELSTYIGALNYPATALTLKLRRVIRATEWDAEKRKSVPLGFDSTATYSVVLVG